MLTCPRKMSVLFMGRHRGLGRRESPMLGREDSLSKCEKMKIINLDFLNFPVLKQIRLLCHRLLICVCVVVGHIPVSFLLPVTWYFFKQMNFFLHPFALKRNLCGLFNYYICVF